MKQPVYDKPHTPRPREVKVLEALVSGKAKTVTQALDQAGFNHSSSTIRERLAPGGDLRNQLQVMLDDAGLSLPVALNKLKAKIDAKKLIQVDKVGVEVDDNDAQLRATEQVIKLHERSGRIPKEAETGSGASITVNIVTFANELADIETKELIGIVEKS